MLLCTRCVRRLSITASISPTKRWIHACSRMKHTKPFQQRWHNRSSGNWLMRGKRFVRQKRPMKKTRPRLPDGHDSPSTSTRRKGATFLTYTMQAVSRGKRSLQRGIIKPSMLPIEVKTQQDPKQIDQVRIVPRNGHYVVEVIYSKKAVQAQVDPSFCVAIDLGVTNLAAITANREGFIPRLVNGRTLTR